MDKYNHEGHEEDISKKARCSRNTVSHIKNGRAHLWLKEKYPDLYVEAISKKKQNKLSRVSILKAFSLLSKTSLNQELISKKARCSKTTIGMMKTGKRYIWLKDLYPNLYNKMLNRTIIRKYPFKKKQ
jgi:hypothetical protein